MFKHFFNARKIILVVEDDRVLRGSIVDTLSTEGYRVIGAHSGREALSVAVQNKPNLILLDLMLPDMDGITTLRELRKDEYGKDARVVVLTNLMGDNGLSEEASSLGVLDYIEKNKTDLSAISEVVSKALKIKKRA